MFQTSPFRSGLRAQIYRQASRALGSGSGWPIHAFPQIPQNARAFSGLNKNSIIDTNLQSSLLGKLGLIRLADNVSLPYALTFKSFIHSGKRAEDEAGRTPPRSMDYVKGLLHEKGNDVNGRAPLYPPQVDSFQGILQERGNSFNGRPPLYPPQVDSLQGILQERGNSFNGRPPLYPPQVDSFQGILQERGNSFNGRPPLYQPQLEANADIVHIKLLRNNAFVTVTDSKGNKKVGVSAGQLAGKGGKINRYSGEAAAEHVGRRVRQMKMKSVVVKVNGLTFFRRKKDAILSFKDGYSNSRGDMNPVVYLEDTTRKPHNGCRLPKKRRI